MDFRQSIIKAVKAGLNIELDNEQSNSIEWIVYQFYKMGDNDKRKLFYILATSWNETKFRNIEERYGPVGLQTQYWGYHGFGLSQLTWKGNYEKYAKIFGIDIVSNPSLILNPELGSFILVHGMMTGNFTGKKLGDFINETTDYKGARWVVNSQDNAQQIADWASAIESNFVTPEITMVTSGAGDTNSSQNILIIGSLILMIIGISIYIYKIYL